MHTFWLVLLVPGLALLVLFAAPMRRRSFWAIGFWVALAGTIAFFGYDLYSFSKFEPLVSANDIGLRLTWKFLMSNGIPFVQATIALGLTWLICRNLPSNEKPDAPDSLPATAVQS